MNVKPTYGKVGFGERYLYDMTTILHKLSLDLETDINDQQTDPEK